MPAWLAHGLCLYDRRDLGWVVHILLWDAGILEVFTAMDNCEAAYVTETGDFHAITGQNPITVSEWVKNHQQAFL
jgi:hypothetical protein